MKNYRIVLFLLVMLFAGCKNSINFALPADDTLELSNTINGKTCKIKPGSPQHELLSSWLMANRDGWTRNPATHVPRIVVSGGNFSINFMDSSVILNYADGQYTHTVSKADYDFLVCDARVGT